MRFFAAPPCPFPYEGDNCTIAYTDVEENGNADLLDIVLLLGEATSWVQFAAGFICVARELMVFRHIKTSKTLVYGFFLAACLGEVVFFHFGVTSLYPLGSLQAHACQIGNIICAHGMMCAFGNIAIIYYQALQETITAQKSEVRRASQLQTESNSLILLHKSASKFKAMRVPVTHRGRLIVICGVLVFYTAGMFVGNSLCSHPRQLLQIFYIQVSIIITAFAWVAIVHIYGPLLASCDEMVIKTKALGLGSETLLFTIKKVRKEVQFLLWYVKGPSVFLVFFLTFVACSDLLYNSLFLYINLCINYISSWFLSSIILLWICWRSERKPSAPSRSRRYRQNNFKNLATADESTVPAVTASVARFPSQDCDAPRVAAHKVVPTEVLGYEDAFVD